MANTCHAMNSKTPIPADSVAVTVTLRREEVAALQKLAGPHRLKSDEDLSLAVSAVLEHMASVAASQVELSPADFQRIADDMARGNQPEETLSLRSIVARLIQVLRLVATGRHNALTLAAKLEVSTKTIQRDLDFLRERVGLTIAYSQNRNAYAFEGFDFSTAIENLAGLHVLELGRSMGVPAAKAFLALPQDVVKRLARIGGTPENGLAEVLETSRLWKGGRP